MVREEAMAAPAMLPPKDSPITSGRLHPTRLEYEAEGWTRSEIAAKRYMAASDGWGYWYMWAWALPFPERNSATNTLSKIRLYMKLRNLYLSLCSNTLVRRNSLKSNLSQRSAACAMAATAVAPVRMRPRLLAALILLFAATLLIHCALFSTYNGGNRSPSPPRPLCLADAAELLVAIPLLADNSKPLADVLARRLHQLLADSIPCQFQLPLDRRPTLLVLVASLTSRKPGEAVELQDVLQRHTERISSCIGGAELLSVPETSNGAFLAAFDVARSRRASMLWLAAKSVPLRPRWLEAMQCELRSGSAGAWIVASALLVDCERAWTPPSAACALAASSNQSAHRLSATGLYAAADDGFVQYVSEWRGSMLSEAPFHVALSALLWAGYHESRQRSLRRRFIASDMVLDFGDQLVCLDEARSIEPHAALLHTTNTSHARPSDGAGAPTLADARAGRPARHATDAVMDWYLLPRLPETTEPLITDTPPPLETVASAGGGASTALVTDRTDASATAGGRPMGADEAAHAMAWGSADDLIAKAAKQADHHSRLIVTFAAPDTPFALNQLAWFERLGLKHWLLVALDESTHAKLCAAASEACTLAPAIEFADDGPLVAAAARAAAAVGHAGDGGMPTSAPGLLLLAAVRVGVLVRLVDAGLHVFACDADALLVRDPWPAIGLALGLNVLSSSDDDVSDGGGNDIGATDGVGAIDGGDDGEGSGEGEEGGSGGEAQFSSDLLLMACGPALCPFNPLLGILDAVGVRAESPLALRLLRALGRAMVRAGSSGRLALTTAPSAQIRMGIRMLVRDTLAATLEQDRAAAEVRATPMLRWQLLDGARFVSHTALMRQPLGAGASSPFGPLVLAATSGAPDWITRRYILRELRLWLLRGGAVGGHGAWLGYDVADADCALYRQRRALKSALMMAHVLKRALVLPRFCEHADGGRTVTMSFLFDYASFAAQFPEHAPAADVAAAAYPPLRFHIALADATNKKSASELNVTGSFKAKSPKGASEGQVRSWLRKWSTQPLLWFDKTYQRLTRLEDLDAGASFDARVRDGLRPAPELRSILEHILAGLRQGVLTGAGFNCMQVSQGDLVKNGAKVFALGARLMNPREPTLLADASLGPSARAHMRQTFRRPLFLSELLPNATRPLVEDAHGRPTLAYEMIELHVCAAADDFGGNMLTPYAHAVCHERDGVLPLPGAAASDVAAVVKDGRVRRQCRDLYRRDAEMIKASRAGRGWF